MTVAEALRAAAERLAVTSDTARLDAELLMAHALGASRSDLLLAAAGPAAPVMDALCGLTTAAVHKRMHQCRKQEARWRVGTVYGSRAAHGDMRIGATGKERARGRGALGAHCGSEGLSSAATAWALAGWTIRRASAVHTEGTSSATGATPSVAERRRPTGRERVCRR